MNEKDLLESGYKRYRNNPERSPHYMSSFQKCIENEHGIKYIIDCEGYSIVQDSLTKKWFNFHTQLKIDGKTFEAKTLNWFTNSSEAPTLEEVENFFENMWIKLECDYYDKYKKKEKK